MRNLVCVLCLLWSLACNGEAISTSPSNPTSSDVISITVSGTLASVFDSAYLLNSRVVGNTVRIEVCVVHGLNAGNPSYQVSANVGPLPSGAYVVESYRVFCLVPTSTPLLTATAPLSVSLAIEAIPAVNSIGLMTLIVTLLLVGARQRYLQG
jgi:hypothetical protein